MKLPKWQYYMFMNWSLKHIDRTSELLKDWAHKHLLNFPEKRKFYLINGALQPRLIILSLSRTRFVRGIKSFPLQKVVIYVNECKVSSLSETFRLTDTFVLTQKSIFKPSQTEVSAPQSKLVWQSQLALLPQSSKEECFYYHKPGHRIANSSALKHKWDR